MNRHFFADEDPEADKQGRCAEVEMIRNYLRNSFNGSMNVGETLQLFLDIHAHSVDTSIFAYAPLTEDDWTQLTTRRWSQRLHEMSPYFNMNNCIIKNEKYKRNCARLGIFRDYHLSNSYTIETSCYGFEQKNQ